MFATHRLQAYAVQCQVLVRRYPHGAAVALTTTAVTGLYLRSSYATRRLLDATQTSMAKETSATVEACQAKLRAIDEDWNAELKRKDELLQKLHVQNVQQTRSIDRLVSALKVCKITPQMGRSERNVYVYLPNDPKAADTAVELEK